MLELTGKVTKIEKSNISGVDFIYFSTHNDKTQIRLDLPKKQNHFKQDDPVKIVFNPDDVNNESQKLLVNGDIYLVKADQDPQIIMISIGGLQLKIETSVSYDELLVKKPVKIQFL